MSRSVAIARLVGRSSRRSSAALVASSSPPLSSSIDAGEVWCNRRVLHSRAFTSDQQAAAAKWTQEAKASSSGGAAAGGREQSSSAQTAAESFAAAAAKMVYATVSQGFQTATASAGSALHKVKETKFVDSMKTGYSFLREELSNTAPRRRRTRAAAAAGPPPAENTQVTAVVPVVKKTTRWEKQWESLKEKAWAHPAFRQLKTVKELPVVTKGQELAEDLRERWETSDSPVVHKIQDLNESIFGETATAVAMREIRQHDPSFSITEFILEVQEDVRPVLRAYLKGDLNVLRERCSREVVERCRAERQALESQGIFLDNKILHISDVEVKDTKLLGNSPIIIVAFQTQQIYCARDRDGNITEGAKDEIHTVHYAWAMQQVIPGEMQEFDIHRRWKLREMQQLGIQALI
ncbi:unnamed protein product [Sphagnum troendelagicum]|uniref:Tim44-like domain-containing protein n=1 Tax=Sphagnum troendelagicum TaxID=128251 RepID=A0ABP0TPQ7_9BRYO